MLEDLIVPEEEDNTLKEDFFNPDEEDIEEPIEDEEPEDYVFEAKKKLNKRGVEMTPAEKRIHAVTEKLNNEIMELELRISDKRIELSRIRSFCNHAHYEEKNRVVAEEDNRYVCLICGEDFSCINA